MNKFGDDVARVRVPAGELRELLSRLASSDGVMDSEQPTIQDVAEVSGKSVGEVAAALTAMRGSQVVALAPLNRQRQQVIAVTLVAVALMFMVLGVLLLSGARAPVELREVAPPTIDSSVDRPAPNDSVAPVR
jgi:hypothetical protein